MTPDPHARSDRSSLMRTLGLSFALTLTSPGCARSGKLSGTDSPEESPPAEDSTPAILHGATALILDPSLGLVEGTAVDLALADGRIAGVSAAGEALPEGAIDLTGRWIVPAFIDSHVHLAYRPDAEGMADGGVAGVVDMAAPISFLSEDHSPLQVRAAGPMITATGGYPTQSWGADGYGLECATTQEAVDAVGTLLGLGASFIKFPLNGAPQLDDEAQAAVVTAAHGLGLKVAVHALDPISVDNAATAGADMLAHTPTATLSEEEVAAWSGKAVVSTLRAFGGSDRAIANLTALQAAGVTVLYGTDYGNTSTAGIDSTEIALMDEAGLSGEQILVSGTSTPAAYWGFTDLGVIGVGARASLLVLAADPREDPSTLAAPVAIYIDGAAR